MCTEIGSLNTGRMLSVMAKVNSNINLLLKNLLIQIHSCAAIEFYADVRVRRMELLKKIGYIRFVLVGNLGPRDIFRTTSLL